MEIMLKAPRIMLEPLRIIAKAPLIMVKARRIRHAKAPRIMPKASLLLSIKEDQR
jgi:hypothetical protein